MSLSFFLKRNLNKIPLGIKVGKYIAKLNYKYRPGLMSSYKQAADAIFQFERTSDDLKKIIFLRIKPLVEHAYKNIPFYREHYDSHGFKVASLNSFDDISNIPIVTKADFKKYDIEQYSFKQPGRCLSNTGGSSGKPFYFYISPKALGHEWAHIHFVWKHLGFDQSMLKLNFAGRSNVNDIVDYYASCNFFSQLIIRLTLKYSDYIFFETKKLCAFFQNYNDNVFWFPNVRAIKQKSFVNKEFCEKYVFISSVKRTKGIYEIVKVFSELSNKYTVDIFGPIEDGGLNARDIEISENIRYRGSVDSNEVHKILDRYNALLLPTFHPGEGYPGVIIEAFAVGLPVITTRWNAIPEMIIDGYNGRLIDPKNCDQLKGCITEMHKEYLKLSKNSYDSFANYNSFDQTRLFLKAIRELS
jgi:glycosyltransferase involved in cell wall biosynthesis